MRTLVAVRYKMLFQATVTSKRFLAQGAYKRFARIVYLLPMIRQMIVEFKRFAASLAFVRSLGRMHRLVLLQMDAFEKGLPADLARVVSLARIRVVSPEMPAQVYPRHERLAALRTFVRTFSRVQPTVVPQLGPTVAVSSTSVALPSTSAFVRCFYVSHQSLFGDVRAGAFNAVVALLALGTHGVVRLLLVMKQLVQVVV